jgi:hypothetical protein
MLIRACDGMLEPAGFDELSNFRTDKTRISATFDLFALHFQSRFGGIESYNYWTN